MCSFDITLSREHEEWMVHLVREMTCGSESKSLFSDALLLVLECVSGFEVMDEPRSQQIVNYFWSKYRGQENDRDQDE